MRKVSINELRAGEILASPIYSDSTFTLLLGKDTRITPEHLNHLQKNCDGGFCFVREPVTTREIRTDLLSRIEDEKAKEAYLDTFIITKSIYENLSQGNPLNVSLACEAADILAGQILLNSSALLQLTAMKAVDDYTFSHMINVAVYAASLARFMNFSIQDLRDICLAGLLHDVGKANIPKEILLKPGRLSPEEFSVVKKHAEFGYVKLKQLDVKERVREVAMQHHERGDGSGYPHGRILRDISLFSRIIAIADVYDALSSDRCYKGRILPDECAEILMADCAVSKLDIDLVRLFLQNILTFPLGAEVELSNGQHARISKLQPGLPLRPVLDVVERKNGGNIPVTGRINLSDHPTLFITKIFI